MALLRLTPSFSTVPLVLASCSAMAAVAPLGATTAEARRSFDLPRGEAATTLRQFAAASGRSLVFVTDKVRGETTSAVRGEYTPRDALERMLAGSALEADQDAATGALVVSRKRTAESKPSNGEVGPVSDPQPNAPSKAMSSKPRTLFAALAAWLVASTGLNAQTATIPAKEEAVTLSPFTVSTDRDTGFAAASSLAGGQLALDLKDTPVAYSVITSEFIAALGITDLREAALWSPNVTPNVNGAGGGFSDDIYGYPVSYSVRGAGGGRQSRNFFVYAAPMDSYSVERFDFARGPNSILFGNGTLGGLSSTMTKVARTGQRFGSVAFTLGSWNNQRSTFDINLPLGDKFAVRAAAVYATKDDWRDRGFDKTRAAFLTSTYKLAKDTTIRLEGEYGEGSRNTPFTNISDQLSGWDGVTTFSGPLTTLPADANARGISRRAATLVFDPFSGVNAVMNYQNDPITLAGGANNQVPIGGILQGALPGFNTVNANLLYSVYVPANRFAKAIAGSAFRLPSERFTVSRDSYILKQKYMDVQLTADHRIGDVYLQAGVDFNHVALETHNLEARGAQQILIDINKLLPNGAPNPHFLQPYNDAQIQRGVTPNRDSVGFRLAAGYRKDAGKWGNYNFSLLGGVTESYEAYQASSLSAAQSADHRVWGTSNADLIRERSYWNDASRPYLTPGSIRYIDPIAGVDKTIAPIWALTNNRSDSAQQTKTSYDYALAALNAKFLGDRVIFLGAVRADKFNSLVRQQVLQGDYPAAATWDGVTRIMKPNAPADYGQLTYIPKTAAGVATGPALPADARPRAGTGDRLAQYATDRFRDDFNAPAVKQTKITRSVGTVVYATKWLSPYFNYAETFNPPQAIQRLDSTFLSPTVAKGIDYGVRLSLLQNRISLSVARYENSEVNNAFDPAIQGNVNSVLSANALGDTSPTGINKRGLVLIPAVIRDVRDRQASGYEFELTVNVTKSWRLIANAGLPKVYETNSFQDSKKYLNTNLGNLKQVVLDAGGLVDANNVATVDLSIPIADRSFDVNGAVTVFNNLIAQQKNFIDGKRLIQDQPNFNFYSDYSFQTGKIKGLRVGAGVQYRGKAIIGNRGADTIVNPANPLAAIDDPAVSAYTPVYALTNMVNAVASLGYTMQLKERRQLVFDLRVDNLFNRRGPIYGATVLRPKGGDYTTPARETVPNLYALLQPISFKLTTTLKF
ncbi:MAG: hypothetical protein EXS41_10180 [Opitutaceae bacterium]|nr:hypothetical protein [Opitutaceae bacterium]